MTRFLTRCFAFFCAAVWVGSSPANAADPVEINVMVSQTGSLAFYGGKQAEAFRAIEMYANANGGVGGRPVKFVLHDDQSNPQTAVQLANQLIEQKVPVIVGPVLTSACAAIMPLLAQNGPVDLCYSPVITPPARGYVFRAAPRIEDVQSVTLLQESRSEKACDHHGDRCERTDVRSEARCDADTQRVPRSGDRRPRAL